MDVDSSSESGDMEAMEDENPGQVLHGSPAEDNQAGQDDNGDPAIRQETFDLPAPAAAETGPQDCGQTPLGNVFGTMPEVDEDELEADLCQSDLMDIAREWVMLQIGKVCSNEVSDAYFSMAWDICEVLARMKESMISKPVFKSLRRKVIEENVPGIKIDFILRDKSKSDHPKDWIFLYNLTSFPVKRYPLAKYEMLNQITRIDVS